MWLTYVAGREIWRTQTIWPQERARGTALGAAGFSVLSSVPCEAWLKPALGFWAPLLCPCWKYPLLLAVIILRGFLLLETKPRVGGSSPLPSVLISPNVFSLGRSTETPTRLVSFFSRTKCSQFKSPSCSYLLASCWTSMPSKTQLLQKASWTTEDPKDPLFQ